MKLWAAAATWFIVSCTVVYGSPIDSSSTAVGYSSLLLNVTDIDVFLYDHFVIRLREALKSDVVSHEIPVLPAQGSVNIDERFVLVTLVNKEHQATLALDVINANIVGFSVGTNSYFFSDVSQIIYTSTLFNETNKARLPFSGSYNGMLIARRSRLNLELGGPVLQNQAEALAKNPNSSDPLALLVLTQMISEAARWDILLQPIVNHFEGGYRIGIDIMSIQDSWHALSIAIQIASADGKFYPIVLRHANLTEYYVEQVDDVKHWFGLLRSIDTDDELHSAY